MDQNTAIRAFGATRLMIGPKMTEAVRFVSQNEGCTKAAVAAHLAPGNNDNRTGYDPVNRALRAGLIENHSAAGASDLRVTAAGLEHLG